VLAVRPASTLTDAGSVAAIIAGSIALVGAVWALGRRAWRTYRASDFDRGLYKDGATGRTFSIAAKSPRAEPEGRARIGIRLTNALERPLGYAVETFTVEIDDQSHPLADRQNPDTLGPTQTGQWLGPPVPVGSWPAQATANFRVCYGPRGRKTCRALEGTFTLTLPRVLAEGETFDGTWDEVGPDRDERVPRRQRTQLR
jgi:hypothetical protein